MSQPNILYIHSHDTGRMIEPYGFAVPTPSLQKLAEEGVLFRQNFCVNPTCSPSRAALLTGCYPHENGMTGLAHRGWRLNDYRQHVVATLKTANYHCALAGIQHVAVSTDDAPAWQTIGYDRRLEGETHIAAADFLAERHEQPFFLSVGFFETHREFPELADSPYDPNYCQPPPPLPDTAETRQDMARYKASAKILDDKVGYVLAALRQNGLDKSTLVICTTDHGIAFPRMKCNLEDSGIGTMLILRGPGGFHGGGIIDTMSSHLDIFPTICDLLEIEPPSWLRGRSLLPLIRREVDQLHDSLFFELNYHAAYEPARAVRTHRWKYIRRYDSGHNRPILANIDQGESKTVWMNTGLAERLLPAEALYDLQFDPNEVNNLVDEPNFVDQLSEMRQRLDRWMVDCNDPLRHGYIAAPATGRINHPEAVSPKEALQAADHILGDNS